eukprot:g438.t1
MRIVWLLVLVPWAHCELHAADTTVAVEIDAAGGAVNIVPDAEQELPEAEPANEPGQEPQAKHDAMQQREQEHTEPEHDPEQEPEHDPDQEPEQAPGQDPEQKPEQSPGHESEHEPKQEPEQSPGHESEHEPKLEPAQEPGQESGQEPDHEPEKERGREPDQEPGQEPEQHAPAQRAGPAPMRAREQAHEPTIPQTDWGLVARTFRQACVASYDTTRLWLRLLLLLALPLLRVLRLLLDAMLPHLAQACIWLWRWLLQQCRRHPKRVAAAAAFLALCWHVHRRGYLGAVRRAAQRRVQRLKQRYRRARSAALAQSMRLYLVLAVIVPHVLGFALPAAFALRHAGDKVQAAADSWVLMAVALFYPLFATVASVRRWQALQVDGDGDGDDDGDGERAGKGEDEDDGDSAGPGVSWPVSPRGASSPRALAPLPAAEVALRNQLIYWVALAIPVLLACLTTHLLPTRLALLLGLGGPRTKVLQLLSVVWLQLPWTDGAALVHDHLAVPLVRRYFGSLPDAADDGAAAADGAAASARKGAAGGGWFARAVAGAGALRGMRQSGVADLLLRPFLSQQRRELLLEFAFESGWLLCFLLFFITPGKLTFIGCLLLAFAYPSYHAIRAIRRRRHAAVVRWLKFFVVLTLFELLHHGLSRLLRWVPLWWHLKLAMLMYLHLPFFSGATSVYNIVVSRAMVPLGRRRRAVRGTPPAASPPTSCTKVETDAGGGGGVAGGGGGGASDSGDGGGSEGGASGANVADEDSDAVYIYLQPAEEATVSALRLAVAARLPDEGMRGTAADAAKLQAAASDAQLDMVARALVSEEDIACGDAGAAVRSISITPPAASNVIRRVGAPLAKALAAGRGLEWVLPAVLRLAQHAECHAALLECAAQAPLRELARAAAELPLLSALPPRAVRTAAAAPAPDAGPAPASALAQGTDSERPRLDLLACVALGLLSETRPELAPHVPPAAISSIVAVLSRRLAAPAGAGGALALVTARSFFGLPLYYRPRFLLQALLWLVRGSAAHAAAARASALPTVLVRLLRGDLPNDAADNAPFGSPDALAIARPLARLLLEEGSAGGGRPGQQAAREGQALTPWAEALGAALGRLDEVAGATPAAVRPAGMEDVADTTRRLWSRRRRRWVCSCVLACVLFASAAGVGAVERSAWVNCIAALATSLALAHAAEWVLGSNPYRLKNRD